MEVTKIPVVTEATGFLLVPPEPVKVDEPVPDMAVATGVPLDSVRGQVQNRGVGRLGVPVEGIPGRSKETRVIDTGMSMPQRCRD